MSKFEVLTAMAFAAFSDAPVDVAVVEVGMGGSWDATNVVDAAIAVITPIGMDHAEYLGATVGEIAAEKAGVIRGPRGEPVAVETIAIIGRQPRGDGRPVGPRGAGSRRCGPGGLGIRGSEPTGRDRWADAGPAGPQRVYPHVFLPLHGEHQAHNAAVALAAVEAFFGAGAQRQLDVDTVRAGFSAGAQPGPAGADAQCADGVHRRRPQSGWRGRRLPPPFAEEFDFRYLAGVVSVMAEKDVAGI